MVPTNADGLNREKATMRDFKTGFTGNVLNGLQNGVMAYTYKGIPCLKCPIDLAIYTKLIWDIRPKTLIEIGTYRGGSALWFADILSAAGIDCPVFTFDHDPAVAFTDPRITFRRADANALSESLPGSWLAALPHPWLVIEDSAHTYETTLAVLRFFTGAMVFGDVIVIEDGALDDLGLTDAYDGGPKSRPQRVLNRTSHSVSRFRRLLRYVREKFDLQSEWLPVENISPAIGTDAQPGHERNGLQRDHQERVDLLAVKDDGALDKAVGAGADIDAVEIAAGGEELAVAVMHDADGQEI